MNPATLWIGAPVLVRWADGAEYPGQIIAVQNDQYLCRFPNGNESWVGAGFVRLVPQAAPAPQTASPGGQRTQARHPAAIAAFLLLTGNIYWLFWIHGTYKEINARAPGAAGISPGAAVGRLFIPMYGLYWFFRIWWDCPRAILRARQQDQVGDDAVYPPLVTGLAWAAFLAAVLFNLLGGQGMPLEILGTGLLTTQAMLTAAIIACERGLYDRGHDSSRTGLHELLGGGSGRTAVNVGVAASLVAAFMLKRSTDTTLAVLSRFDEFRWLRLDDGSLEARWSGWLDFLMRALSLDGAVTRSALFGATAGIIAFAALRLIPSKIGAAAAFAIVNQAAILILAMVFALLDPATNAPSTAKVFESWLDTSVLGLSGSVILLLALSIAFEWIRPTWFGLWLGFVVASMADRAFGELYNALVSGYGFGYSLRDYHYRLLVAPLLFSLVFVGGLHLFQPRSPPVRVTA